MEEKKNTKNEEPQNTLTEDDYVKLNIVDFVRIWNAQKLLKNLLEDAQILKETFDEVLEKYKKELGLEDMEEETFVEQCPKSDLQHFIEEYGPEVGYNVWQDIYG